MLPPGRFSPGERIPKNRGSPTGPFSYGEVAGSSRFLPRRTGPLLRTGERDGGALPRATEAGAKGRAGGFFHPLANSRTPGSPSAPSAVRAAPPTEELSHD